LTTVHHAAFNVTRLTQTAKSKAEVNRLSCEILKTVYPGILIFQAVEIELFPTQYARRTGILGMAMMNRRGVEEHSARWNNNEQNPAQPAASEAGG